MSIQDFQYSVIICTYNGQKYILELLESIMSQLVTPSEIVVSDDGSTDSTLSIIRQFELKYSNVKIRYIDGPRKGPSVNFITALSIAKYDWVFLSDQDDIWVDNKVDKYFSHVRDQYNPLMLFSDAALIDNDGKLLFRSHLDSVGIQGINLDQRIFYKNPIQGATILLNRSMLDLIVFLSSNVRVTDVLMYDWWIGILSLNVGKVIFIDEKLLLYRIHDGNLVGITKRKAFLRFKSFYKLVNQTLLLFEVLSIVSLRKADKTLRLSRSGIKSVGLIRYVLIYSSVMAIFLLRKVVKYWR